jgi:hypothetical protein
MIAALAISFGTNTDCTPVVPFRLRTDRQGQICFSSGDPDPGASVIRGSKLTPIAKMRALDVLRQARGLGDALTEDVGLTSDGGVALEFAGPSGRELMIAIGTSGGWTYFSAAVDGRQTKAGILRDDGLPWPVLWVAGSRDELVGPGVIIG